MGSQYTSVPLFASPEKHAPPQSLPLIGASADHNRDREPDPNPAPSPSHSSSAQAPPLPSLPPPSYSQLQQPAPSASQQQQKQQATFSNGGTTAAAAAATAVPLGQMRTIASAAEATLSDTLDEPVSATLMRDLRAIGVKLKAVCFPRVLIPNSLTPASSAGLGLIAEPSEPTTSILREWDLWGPLFVCLTLAVCMSVAGIPSEKSKTSKAGSSADDDKASGLAVSVFTGFFVIFWVGASVVTLNAKLLGARLSFFQSLCVLGYSMFPLMLSSVVSLLVQSLLIRSLVGIATLSWSILISIGFLKGVNLERRIALAMYPISLLYFVISWMIIVTRNVTFNQTTTPAEPSSSPTA